MVFIKQTCCGVIRRRQALDERCGDLDEALEAGLRLAYYSHGVV